MLLVAYPLSTGPVAWLFVAFGVDDNDGWQYAFRFVYSPVLRIVRGSPDAATLYWEYLKLWIGDF